MLTTIFTAFVYAMGKLLIAIVSVAMFFAQFGFVGLVALFVICLLLLTGIVIFATKYA